MAGARDGSYDGLPPAATITRSSLPCGAAAVPKCSRRGSFGTFGTGAARRPRHLRLGYPAYHPGTSNPLSGSPQVARS